MLDSVCFYAGAGPDADAGLGPEQKLQRRDESIKQLQAALELAQNRAHSLQQRIQDLFGAEAAAVDVPRLHYTHKQGACIHAGAAVVIANFYAVARLITWLEERIMLVDWNAGRCRTIPMRAAMPRTQDEASQHAVLPHDGVSFPSSASVTGHMWGRCKASVAVALRQA